MENIKTKKCIKCGEEKPIRSEYFYKVKGNKDGFRNDCKICCRKLQKIRKAKNKSHYDDYIKKYRLKNRDKIREVRRKYYNDNKERILEQNKIWIEENNDYRKKYVKEYKKSNSEKIRKTSSKYFKDRRKNDILFGLQTNIGNLLRVSFKKMKWSKKTKTQHILGCDWESFKQHIENQFQEGMTWDNHGIYGWHYDHIVPISSAKTEEDAYRLNHYTNFQPLWAEDNLKKSDKISEKWGNLNLTVSK